MTSDFAARFRDLVVPDLLAKLPFAAAWTETAGGSLSDIYLPLMAEAMRRGASYLRSADLQSFEAWLMTRCFEAFEAAIAEGEQADRLWSSRFAPVAGAINQASE